MNFQEFYSMYRVSRNQCRMLIWLFSIAHTYSQEIEMLAFFKTMASQKLLEKYQKHGNRSNESVNYSQFPCLFVYIFNIIKYCDCFVLIKNLFIFLFKQFPDAVSFAETMANEGKVVIVAALDGTFQRKVCIVISSLLKGSF